MSPCIVSQELNVSPRKKILFQSLVHYAPTCRGKADGRDWAFWWWHHHFWNILPLRLAKWLPYSSLGVRNLLAFLFLLRLLTEVCHLLKTLKKTNKKNTFSPQDCYMNICVGCWVVFSVISHSSTQLVFIVFFNAVGFMLLLYSFTLGVTSVRPLERRNRHSLNKPNPHLRHFLGSIWQREFRLVCFSFWQSISLCHDL